MIGVGNEFRGDDAAGIVAARGFGQNAPAGVSTCEANGEGVALMALWEGFDTVYLIDAMQSGVPAGEVVRFEAQAGPLPASLHTASSHAFGVAQAIELGRRLGRLPRRLVVYGIEARQFTTGQPLTPEVEQAARRVGEAIAREISASSAG